MSFARFGPDSDVYVYSDVGGYIACCGCILRDKWDYHSIAELVAHMQKHVDAGNKVPDYLLDPATYEGENFVAMCMTYMCREDEGHDGPHTPTDLVGEGIRSHAEVQKLDALLRATTEGNKE